MRIILNICAFCGAKKIAPFTTGTVILTACAVNFSRVLVRPPHGSINKGAIMPKVNIRISLICEGAKETAAKIEEQVKQLFGEMELKQGEELEITVSNDFSMQTLPEKLRDDHRKGLSIEQIAEKHWMPEDRVRTLIKEQ